MESERTEVFALRIMGECVKAGRRGRRPLRVVTRGAGRAESPSHGFAVTAPFRQGGQGDGRTDCHNQ